MKQFILLAALALSACAPTYQDELDQKLAGKTPEEKRTILKQECGQQLSEGRKTANAKKVPHYDHMQKVCEEMTKNN